MKHPAATRRPNRWAIGAVVGLAVVVILGLKLWPSSTGADAPAPVGTFYEVPDDPYPSAAPEQVAWVLRNERPALLLFHSTTCVACKAMAQRVGAVEADYQDRIAFIDVLVSDRANGGLIQMAGVRSIPTTVFVTAAGEGQGIVGALPEEALRGFLDELAEGAGR
jgi:thiol-disulfide isomerase/thioredoxin